MNLLHDAYTALLSGLTTKTGNEIHWEDKNKNPITVELINVNKEIYKAKCYWPNGNKQREADYQKDQKHGKSIGWYESGNKHWEADYQKGQLHGKNIVWWESGNKHWEADYQKDQRHGKNIGWYESGKVLSEEYYKNDKLIRKIK